MDALTVLRVSFATQHVTLMGASSEVSSTRNALNVPAGTVTLSDPTTFNRMKVVFCLCASMLRKVVV